MRKLSKRMLAVFIAMLMIFSLAVTAITPVGAATEFPAGLAIFLRPNEKWLSGDVKFAMYCTGGPDVWLPMEDFDSDDYYKAEIPAGGIDNIVFGCFDASVETYSTDTAKYVSYGWSYDGTNNCYTLIEGYTDGRGAWSTYEDDWIYFINTYGWDNVYACFYDDNLTGNSWPGTKCKVINQAYLCYGIQVQDYEFVTFSDGKNKGNYSKRYKCTDVLGKGISDNNNPGVFDSWMGTYTYALNYDANFGSNRPKDTPTVSLSGTFNGWSLTEDVFTREFGCDYHYSIYLPSGMYQFKIVHNSLWYGSNYTVGLWIDPIELSATKDNINLISQGGTFDFYYNTTDHKMTVDYTDDVLKNECSKKIALSGSFNDWGLNHLMTPVPEIIEYYVACDASQTTLNGALTSIGVDNSKENRMKIAKANGISDYSYTPEQNTQMLNLLKAGKLINPECLTTGDDETTVYTYITLKKGTYYFSMVEDGLWYGNTNLRFWDGSDNYSSEVLQYNGGACVLKASGYATSYRIKYNYLTKEVEIQPSYDYDVLSKVNLALVGNFNNWDVGDKFNFITQSGGFTKTVTLNKGTYYFKIVENGAWYGCDEVVTDKTPGTHNGYKIFEDYAGNCVLKATGGKYVFSYDVRTKQLRISHDGDSKYSEVYDVSLAGDFNSWSKTNAVMEPVSDTEVATTVTLDAGLYDFKVVKDGLWYGNGSSFTNTVSDASLSMTGENSNIVATGGDYTFTYDVVDDTLTVTAVLSNKDAADNYDVYLSGEFNSWSRKANPMTKTSSEVVSATVSLKAGQYDFKIIKDAFWYGNTKSFTDTTTGLALSYTSGNCSIVTSGGDYTFKFNVVTNKLTVTYVASAKDEAIGYTAALSGEFNSWSKTSDMLTYHSTNKIATTIHLDYGSYDFKIVDTLWYGSAEDIDDETSGYIQLSSTATECTINASGGDYTFIYDVVTKKLKVTAVVSETDLAKDAVVSLAGEFNDWDVKANAMKYYGKNTMAVTLDIPAGSHYFKVVHDSLWYGSDKEIFDNTETNGAEELSILAGECKIHAKGGSYTFIYNVMDHSLEVVNNQVELDYTKDAVVSLAGEFNDWNKYTTPMAVASYTTMTVDVYLTAGSYYFKIVHDGNWYGNSGAVITDAVNNLPTSNTATDILLKATNAGTYTFVYNVVNNSLTVSCSSEDTTQYASVNISGDFNDWSKEDALTYSGAGVFTITKTLGAGTYKFKMINDGEWYGNNGTIENTTTTSSNIGWAMTNSAGDCTLKADGGSYTFKYNANTNFLEVVYNG